MPLSAQAAANIRRALREARRLHAANTVEVNAAANAIVDAFTTACRPILSSAIEDAAPGKFTNADKTALVLAVIFERVL